MIDYTAAKFDEIVRDVDLVLDAVGSETLARSWVTLRPGGTLVSLFASSTLQEEGRKHGVYANWFLVRPDANQLTEIATRLAAGNLQVEIEQVYPLSDARSGLERVITGRVRGKLVLRV